MSSRQKGNIIVATQANRMGYRYYANDGSHSHRQKQITYIHCQTCQANGKACWIFKSNMGKRAGNDAKDVTRVGKAWQARLLIIAAIIMQVGVGITTQLQRRHQQTGQQMSSSHCKPAGVS